MALSFVSEDALLFPISDTVPSPLDRPEWLPVFDTLPDEAGTSKQRIIDRSANEKAQLARRKGPKVMEVAGRSMLLF